ncbi:MAG: iron-containing alcohol dehydrogenase [Chryseosolibacter sp.]
MIRDFAFAPTPQLHFGAGKFSVLPGLIRSFGSKALLVTGARSFMASSHGKTLLQTLKVNSIEWVQCQIGQEPTPGMIDAAVSKFSSFAPDCVAAIGGGSALDAGKAISAMLPLNEPVKDYLEGVGTKSGHPGAKIPFIAVPTTSGTGSEATKNAVIAETGEKGYKRSLRHNNFVPNLAIVDPALTIGCPKSITAASGMDAFTQLLESYVSTVANPMTDALAYEGLQRVARSLKRAFDDGGNLEARTDMALASYLSGITLANAGLGLVHGFASPVGGFFEIPHGVICSAMMGPANKLTVHKLRKEKTNPEALRKYAAIGKIFARAEGNGDDYYIDLLLATIESLTAEMGIPKLSHYRVGTQHFQKIVKETANKNNPIDLDQEEMTKVLEMSVS